MGIVQTGMNDGTIDWTFTLDNALTQYLGEGETVTVVYRVSIDDGSGAANAVQTQDITVTITGTNDIPVATGNVGAVNEDDTLLGDVSVNDTDADDSAVLTYVLTAPIDGLTMNADGSYSFDADHPTYAHLADGAIEVVNAAYIVTDDQGATDTETLVITITGVNDAPNLAGPVLATAFEDDTSFLIDLLSGASDVDDGDSVSIANVTGLTAGVTLAGTLLTVDPTDAAFQSLIEGEELIIVVSYDVVDLNGGISPQTATITITGQNDDPVVAAAVTGGSTEDDAGFSVDMLAGASDIDAMSVINVDAGSVVLVSGDASGVTVNGNSLDVDPSIYNYLANGETAVIVYSYDIIDGVGGSVTQTATITITGVDDAAVVTGDIAGAVTEGDLADITTFAGNLAIDDPDTSDTPEFNVVAPTTGDNGYGTFEITNTGDWVYTLDQAAVDGLDDGTIVMDTFTFAASDGTTQFVEVTINATNNVVTLTNFADSFTGSAGIDIVDGLDGADVILGGAGDDVLMGGAGNDQLTGGLGADVLDGGAGIDRVLYNFSSTGLTINAINTALNTGEASGDTYISIENFFGSNFDDTLTSGNGNNDLVGLNGNDVLIGAGGRDRLFGGNGDDRLLGGTGNDDLTGAAGADTYVIQAGAGRDRIFTFEVGIDTIEMRDAAASFAELTITQVGANTEISHANGVTVLMGITAGTVTAGDFTFINPLPTPTGVDVTTNLTAGDDTFTGDANNDIVNGLAGNDVIRGGIGDDTLNGGDGNDQLTGGFGADVLDGGAGTDRVLYSNASTGVTINAINSALNTGEASGDTYISIENFYGSAHNDSITGDNGNNDLVGLDGNDILVGAGGNDRLFGGNDDDRLLGGAGNDDLYGQGGSDTYVIRAAAGNDRIFGFEDGVDIIEMRDGPANFAALTITQVGADTQVVSVNGTLTIKAFTATDLDASDFTFFNPIPPAEAPSTPKGSAAQESETSGEKVDTGLEATIAQDDIATFLIQSPPTPGAESKSSQGAYEFSADDDSYDSALLDLFI